MINEVFMPALSSTMTEGKIVSWVKSPGDKVERGETVLVVESDKADMDVESFHEGYLAVIMVPAGESAPVGNTIALIAETEAEIETAKQQASSKSAGASATPAAAVVTTEARQEAIATVASAQGGQNGTSARNGRTIISPRARKLAKEFGVELATLKGSGPHGRIVAQDVEAAAGKAPQVQAPAAIATPAVPAPVAAKAAPAIPA